MKTLLLVLTLSVSLSGIFLNEDGTKSLDLSHLDPAFDSDMSDSQKVMTLANFNDLTAEDLDGLSLRDPPLATPGDVFGVGLLPKTDHLLERTPNLRYVQVDHPVAIAPKVIVTKKIIKPSVEIKTDYRVIEQPEFVQKDVTLAQHDLSLPMFYRNEAGEICLPDLGPIKFPRMTLPGAINADLPRINLDELNAQLPSLNLQKQQIELPSVNVMKIDSALPDIDVQAITHDVFPDINVPGVDANLPEISLPSAQNVAMPKVQVPGLDHSMPKVRVPQQDQLKLPDVSLPGIDSELPDLDLKYAEHENLPDFQLPDLNTTIPDNAQGVAINVDVPAIRLPDLNVDAARHISSVNVDQIVPHLQTAAFATIPDDIATAGRNFDIPSLMPAGAGAFLPDMSMQGNSAIAPHFVIPKIHVSVPQVKAKVFVPVIRKKIIQIPRVHFPMPNIGFHPVRIPSLPKIKNCFVNCAQVVVADPEPTGSVQMHPIPQKKVLTKDMAKTYMMVPKNIADSLLLKTFQKKNEPKAKNTLVGYNKYWLNKNLPNEVARAYGLRNTKFLAEDPHDQHYVGVSRHS